MASVGTYQSNSTAIGATIRVYLELVKMRLSLLVAFSSGFGYTLGAVNFSWTVFAMLFVGGFLVSGASITINQIIEKDLDKLMKRTEARPLPTARITVSEAKVFAAVIGLLGIILLAVATNWLTVVLSLVSMVLYCFVYTPLKRVGPVAVFVGALPGALPPLIGWVAATGTVSIEALVIFALQFIWQFPHFWAIAWVADDDYKKAGFKLLPSGGGKDLNTAFQIMIYTLFLGQTFYLMKTGTDSAAKKIMYWSFLYLPVVQIAFILDRV